MPFALAAIKAFSRTQGNYYEFVSGAIRSLHGKLAHGEPPAPYSNYCEQRRAFRGPGRFQCLEVVGSRAATGSGTDGGGAALGEIDL